MKSLLFWTAFAKGLLALVILYSGIGLMPDEAQYWTWSKELSYGYYSKPPGIAWQIALGTWLFGDTEFGVRFGSLLLSFALSLAIYWLARAATLDHKKAFWTSIAFSYCPLGFLSGFFATTDCAYVLFWTLGVAIVVNDLTKNRPLSFLALGTLIAIGALWKWPIYCLWLPVLAFFWRSPIRVALGLLVSLFGLLPSFLWNVSRGFPTFQHVAASIDVVGNPARPNPLEFLGAQLALVSPLFFILILYAFVRFRDKSLPLRFCWWTSVAFFGVVFGASFFEKVQGNWAVAAYPTAFVIMQLYAPLLWTRLGVALSCVMLVACFYVPKIFGQGLGWTKVERALQASGYDVKKDFLFSDRYQATSILSFYGLEKKRAFFFNIHGLRHNQYDFWPTMSDKCQGQTGYFVEFVHEKDAENASGRFKDKLKDYFSLVTIMPSQQLYKDKVAVVLRCEGYNGRSVPSTNKY